MDWDSFPQETVDFIFMEVKNFSEAELYEKLKKEALTEEDLNKITNFIWDMDEKHPTAMVKICKKLIISLAKEKLEAKLNGRGGYV